MKKIRSSVDAAGGVELWEDPTLANESKNLAVIIIIYVTLERILHMFLPCHL